MNESLIKDNLTRLGSDHRPLDEVNLFTTSRNFSCSNSSKSAVKIRTTSTEKPNHSTFCQHSSTPSRRVPIFTYFFSGFSVGTEQILTRTASKKKNACPAVPFGALLCLRSQCDPLWYCCCECAISIVFKSDRTFISYFCIFAN